LRARRSFFLARYLLKVRRHGGIQRRVAKIALAVMAGHRPAEHGDDDVALWRLIGGITKLTGLTMDDVFRRKREK